jgi:hypothetical protein
MLLSGSARLHGALVSGAVISLARAPVKMMVEAVGFAGYGVCRRGPAVIKRRT